ncbi:hypothetical protein EV182_001526 [Spiromyces aspiralis]|uniref:Uncharacterized protein n=1 Tax=Spiromyces aspiralis TaxID=68401 RepID=A0ACC1HT03_9FUNG|nr:hypothetical protein EV182_001526 [Spiromyces aspiralis]
MSSNSATATAASISGVPGLVLAGAVGTVGGYMLFHRLSGECMVKLHHASETVAVGGNDDQEGVTLADLVKAECPALADPKEAYFYPTPYLQSGHLQTIYNTVMAKTINHINDVKYERELVSMSDGGTVGIDWTPSFESVPRDDRPIVVVLHGLTGGSHEYYVRAVAKKFISSPFNFRVVVANFRGCGQTKLTSARFYSGGYTDDIRYIIRLIHERFPTSQLFGIGFSLGSNVLVKYLGEESDQCLLSGAISVCNPFDFVKGAQNLGSPTFFNKYVYQPNLTGALKRLYFRNRDSVTGFESIIDEEEIKKAKTLPEYDNAVTTKLFGFDSCWDYYRDASSSQYIKRVRTPLLCVNALDDPISPAAAIPFDEIKDNPHVVLATTKYGGHLGWFTGTTSPMPWYPQPFAEFFHALARRCHRPQ